MVSKNFPLPLIFFVLFAGLSLRGNPQSTSLQEEEVVSGVGVVAKAVPNSIAQPGGPSIRVNLTEEGSYSWGRVMLKLKAPTSSSTGNWSIRILDNRGNYILSVPSKSLEDAKPFWTRPLSSKSIKISVPGNGAEVMVVAVARGTDPVSIESSVGRPNLRSINFAEAATKIARGTVLLEFFQGEIKRCNALIVAPKIVMTNNHCIYESKTLKENYYPRIYVDFASNLDPGSEVPVERLIYTSEELDMSLLRLANEVPDSDARILTLSSVDPTEGANLELVQYYKPLHWKQVISDDGDCKVSGIPVEGRKNKADLDFFHGCDTEKGSSGSAVASKETGYVVGLHHYGKVGSWKFNKSVRMSLIVNCIRSLARSDPETYKGFVIV